MVSAVDTGVGTIRDVSGTCDWCGDACHANTEICVGLSCQRCDTKIYHQACVEKYLKKIGLPASRKSGFSCPYGKGKVTQDECKGRVEKSHPIIPKNEQKKQQRLAPHVLEAMANPRKAASTTKAAQLPKGPPTARKMAPPKPYIARLSVPHTGPAGQAVGCSQQGMNVQLAHSESCDSSESQAGAPRPAQLPVGLVIEEAMTKAQKKNLARKKKRQATAQADSMSESSSEHQELVTAALEGSDDVGAQVSACALYGFDGTAIHGASDDLLAQQGHRFITSAEAYARLLGLLGDAESEEGDAEDHNQSSVAYGNTAGKSETPSTSTVPERPAAHPGLTAVAAASVSSVMGLPGAATAPDPTSCRTAPLEPSVVLKDTPNEEADLEATIAASIQQYKLEEELRRQQEVLVRGVQASFIGPSACKSVLEDQRPPHLQHVAPQDPITGVAIDPDVNPGVQLEPSKGFAPVGDGHSPQNVVFVGDGVPHVIAPVAAPVTAPVAVPVATPVAVPVAPVAVPAAEHVAVPVAVPAAAPVVAPFNLFAGIKQQQDVGGSSSHCGWVFGGASHTPAALPPHIPAAYAPQYAAPLIAGHSAPEVVGDEEDDDLSTLLALCGVAG